MTHRLTLMFSLLLVLPLSGCLMTEEWHGPLPRSGAKLSNDQRMQEFTRFSEIVLQPDSKALQGSPYTGKLYSGESFAPVIDSLDPSLYLQLREAQTYNYARQATTVAAAVAGASAATATKRRERNISLAVTVLISALDYWFNSKVDDLMDSANKRYQDRLDERIFPQNPKQAAGTLPSYEVLAWQLKSW